MSEIAGPDHILVVDPDVIVRQPLAEYLRECGYKVFEAIDTDEATHILTEGDVTIDIVLCDVASPGRVNGFGLAQWVRARRLHCQVILAGTVESAARKAGELCEDSPLAGRPYDHSALLDRIKRLLAQRDRSAKGSKGKS